MKSIFIILFSIIFSSLGQGQELAKHFKTKDFDVAIFPKEYSLNGFENRFTPSEKEIELAEKALKNKIKSLNKTFINQSSRPSIHRNLKKYKRQYFGIYNEFGEKILLINCHWEKSSFEYWLEEKIEVEDGGSYFWEIKYSLDSNNLFDLFINGFG